MKQKNVLICGASQGLGLCITHRFIKEGYNVINLDIIDNPNSPAYFYPCDVSNLEQTQKCIEEIMHRFGNIDVLINCIRWRKKQDPPNSVFQNWENGLKIDLNTYFHACLFVCEKMKEKECNIINISSVVSQCITLKEPLSYHVAKAAINQLTRYLAVEFGPKKIRVNAIIPGLISNDQVEQSSLDSSASLYAKLANHIPLRRSGAPEEVADLAFFLASPSSSFITGQCIAIDGGLTLREQVDLISEVKILYQNEASYTDQNI